MTDKYDFLWQCRLLREKFTAVLKKIFCDKFFAREKNSDDERFTRSENSARNENFAARKFSPQRKFREQYYRQYYRQQNFAHDKKGFF